MSLCLRPDAPGQQDIEDLDHYEMKEEEPADGKKSEDDGIEKENLAILEKIRKNQRQDHLNVSAHSVGGPFLFFFLDVISFRCNFLHLKHNCTLSITGLISISGSNLCVVSSCAWHRVQSLALYRPLTAS